MGSSQRNVNLQHKNTGNGGANRNSSAHHGSKGYVPRKMVFDENPMWAFLQGYKPKSKKKRSK